MTRLDEHVRPLGLPLRGGTRAQRGIEFLCFSLVGLSGVAVNVGAYYGLTRPAGMALELAAPVAIELSVIWNFLLNDRWTFRRRRTDSGAAARLGRFHAVSLVAGLVNYGLLLALVRLAGWPDVPANVCGIVVGAAAKFAVNSAWTWREAPAGEAATMTMTHGGIR